MNRRDDGHRRRSTPTVRCAIYTRKSSEEGLDQDFNSLDAQREACEAFIQSQKHEGWRAIPDAFDDGGHSGGTLDRPALQRLLTAIKAGNVDVVVVYKVDRLTRSLSDFARIVETFDAQGVSFVSVTQQFNTTTSMGRLTLNVLLSFAQFEREVTGERIRDKIAASKKKGMWMGGNVPLGYDAKDRSLFVNETEAAIVQSIFQLYLGHCNVRRVVVEVDRRGLLTKTGRPFSQGHLYQLLQNPIYVGEIRHRDRRYPGLHRAIIDRETWDAVQARLAANRVDRRNGKQAREPSLLAGRLFDDHGQPFTPSHAVKAGRRYRYYIERIAITGKPAGRRPRRRRIAAAEIEGLVVGAVRRLSRSPSDLIAAMDLPELPITETKAMTRAGRDLARQLGDDPGRRHLLIRALVTRVTVSDAAVRIDLDRGALDEALEIGTVGDPQPAGHHTITVPAVLRARGVELKFVIDGPAGERPTDPDPSLIKAIVRAHDWWNRLLSGRASITGIARTEGVTGTYVRRILELAFLAPDVTAAILDGRQPIDLTADRLTKPDGIPLTWADQRRRLGFTRAAIPESPPQK